MISAERLRRWFFPPEVELPEHVRQLVRTIYPTLDLKALRFHLGIPHVFNLFAIQGITLPGRLRPRRARIYVDRQYWDPGSVEGLGLLLHEAYHALQIQEGGPGLGLLRPFLILYLACAAGNGFRYAGHPMEDDAYGLAGDPESRFETTFRAADIGPEACECMATPSSGLAFWRRLAESAPGWRRAGRGLRALLTPWVALWFLFWTSAVAILAILKGLVEMLGALAVGGLSLSSVRPSKLRD
ncbi:MAG: hypothetical protein ABUT39_03535 [Acidobacteriota bacterium]